MFKKSNTNEENALDTAREYLYLKVMDKDFNLSYLNRLEITVDEALTLAVEYPFSYWEIARWFKVIEPEPLGVSHRFYSSSISQELCWGIFHLILAICFGFLAIAYCYEPMARWTGDFYTVVLFMLCCCYYAIAAKRLIQTHFYLGKKNVVDSN